jgi:putative NADH-flavin reductase
MTAVAIIGASGVVGSRALHHLLAREEVGRVVALGRRPAPLQHERLVSRIVDLQSATTIATELPDDLGVAISCIGTTLRQAGSRSCRPMRTVCLGTTREGRHGSPSRAI